MSGVEAYPLQWPAGWPRTAHAAKKDGRNEFKRPSEKGWREAWTLADARDALLSSVQMMGGRNVVISSNFPLRRDGMLSGSGRAPDDEAIALYFVLKGKPMAMACDRYHYAVGNLRSLALAIDAMRQLERHGGGTMMDRAFEGFLAIAAPGKTPWWQVLGIAATATKDEINAAFRRLAAERHPDRQGGSDAMMADLNVARDAGLKDALS